MTVSYREPIRYIDRTSWLAICAIVALSTLVAKGGLNSSLNFELKNNTQIISCKEKNLLN